MAIVSPRALTGGYDPVPVDWNDEAEHRRMLANAINELRNGKVNSRGEVTLTANQATTTLSNIDIGPESFIGFTPTTANAATELATMYVSSRGQKTATITHANNAQIDRTFSYVVLG